MSTENPQNVVQEVEDQWHKICALLLHKFNLGHVVISNEDLNNMAAAMKGEQPIIVLDPQAEGVHIELMPESAAHAYAAAAQGALQ